MILTFIWTSSIKTVDLPRDYWLKSQNYYKYVYRFLAEKHQVIVCLLSNESQRQSHVEDHVRYEFFPVEGGKEPRGEYSYEMIKFLNEVRPDVITLYLMNRRQVILCLENQLPNSSYVLHTSSARTCGSTIDYLNSSENKIDLIICHSNFVRQKLMLNLRKQDPVLVIPSGADTAKFIPKPYPKEFDFIWVGINRILTQKEGTNKNLGFLIEVIRHFDANLLIVGGGRLMALFKEQIRRSGLLRKTIFVGYRSQDEVAKFLQKSKIFVLPSISDASPRAVSEAMACGLPLVGLDECIGTEDQIIHNLNGFRVLNICDCVEKLKLLLAKDDLRNKYGAESRRICVMNFNAEKQRRKLAYVYEKLLNNSKNTIRDFNLTENELICYSKKGIDYG